ncbi:MAG TPA: hypothetical protein VNN12_09770 [Dehalococcoidia bacterium]|nr:hypothetical protein [Dehalococcoidia bacterium]
MRRGAPGRILTSAVIALAGLALILGGRALYEAVTEDSAARAAQVHDRAMQAMDHILGRLGPDSTFHQKTRVYGELYGARYVEQWATFGPDGLLEDIGLVVTAEDGAPLSELVRDGKTISVRYLDTGIEIRLGVIGELSVEDLRSRLAEAFQQQLGRLAAPEARWTVEQTPDEILLQTEYQPQVPGPDGISPDEANGPRRVRTVSHIDPGTYVTRKWESFEETPEGWKLVEWRENLIFEVVPRSAFVPPAGTR